jgi:hypothetical protein
MLNQNDMRIGSFYSLGNLNLRLYDFAEIAFFRVNKDILGKDFCKLEGILFDSNWKKKVSADCSLALWKYASRKFVHEVQRDYFNDFGKELRFDVGFEEDKILD